MKKIILILLAMPLIAFSQNNKAWHLLDPEIDNMLGISSNRAYEYLKGRTPDTVVVAIIDNGADLAHEDLQGVFWVNKNEIAGNGIDDDGNGYIDDINGWNFIGNKDGRNLKFETTELTRLYAYLSNKYKNMKASDIDPQEYKRYQEVVADYANEVRLKNEDIELHKRILTQFLDADRILTKHFKRLDYKEEDVIKIKKNKAKLIEAKEFMLRIYKAGYSKEVIEDRIKNLEKDLVTRLNPEFRNREDIVGDNPNDIRDSIYGNNMLNVRGPWHGTAVSGIVGALNNDFGINGIATHVKLIILRIVPNGDERDKDFLLAVRYAIKNGAQIINCSFGKKYSTHPEFAEMAVKEAEEANVLLILASGNSSTDNDEIPYYPTGNLSTGFRGKTCIRVGATSKLDDEKLVAFFSNYGYNSVDVFAPGVNIPVTGANNTYDKASGTSSAAPVLVGLAAVLKSYYPELSASQLKEIILKSSYKPKTQKVLIPGKKAKIDFNKLSVSGGIANLYLAVMLIESEYINKK